jgi:hypothetical protein
VAIVAEHFRFPSQFSRNHCSTFVDSPNTRLCLFWMLTGSLNDQLENRFKGRSCVVLPVCFRWKNWTTRTQTSEGCLAPVFSSVINIQATATDLLTCLSYAPVIDTQMFTRYRHVINGSWLCQPLGSSVDCVTRGEIPAESSSGGWATRLTTLITNLSTRRHPTAYVNLRGG